ncbi:hypothetical protein SAMN06297468_0324 [Altererythrobacter xiamenensis]|uniref:Uncharacterized protein n=1 Tax=Altererythrobacter xiamenensis TaxID=1316679 RepID=A0A1Y6EGQ9_9SPHN|nr:hypothetical protein [Altererythrobacter xiamenensis]SMQ59772.1 hypothetical protein SAMN06297468_0324 [Altererythrobacter xiamenensis]
MRRSIAILTAALCLSACNSETSETAEAEDLDTSSYTIDEKSGETTATITTEDGVATMRSGESVPVDLPEGFSLFPGAQVNNNTTFSLDDSRGAMIMFQSDAEPQAIADFYRKQAEAARIEIEVELSINGGKTLGGESESGRTFTLNASREGETTSAQLMVGEKLGR